MGYVWEKEPSMPSLAYTYEIGPEAFKNCNCPMCNGCAIRYESICVIHAPSPPSPYLDWHERKHCAGYKHD